MAYNDQTVAINPDGDGNSVFYSDQNPTINGQYIGGGYTFGADGSQNGHATAQIIWGRHHVASANGYYIMCDDRMFTTSDTFTTQQVINSSGQWVGGNLYLQGDGYITRGASSSKISIWAGGTYQGGQIDYFGGGGQTDCGTLIFRTGVGAGTTAQPERMRISNDGYVGIGATSPTLSQSGTGLHICGTNPGIRLDAGSTGWSYLEFYRGATAKFIQGYRDVNGFYRITPGSSLSTCTGITMNSNGYVGIGVCSTPQQQLEVHGNILLGANDVSSFIHGGGNVALSADASLMFVSDSNTTSGSPDSDIVFGGGSSADTDGNRSFDYTSAYPSNAPRCEWMRIRYTGNIGIGTTEPSERLTLASAGKIALFRSDNCRRGLLYTDNIATVLESDTTSNDPLTLSSPGTTGRVQVNVAGSEKMRIISTGNVGINCTSPGSKLTVGGTLTTTDTITTTSGTVSNYLTYTATTGVIGTQTNHSLQIRTNDTERLRVTCTGCIGVNITSPTYMLHVNGTFYSAGSSCEYKTQICNYNTDSCMFMKLKPVTYQYKDEWCHLGKELKSGTQIGLIAEDTAEVFPELAILKEEENEKVVRNVDYEKLTIILLSEVQKLRQEVDQLKNK